MITHYIYEIPACQQVPKGKVGCTTNIKKRIKKYPEGTPYIILQVCEDITNEEAGETEIIWQYKRGYERDNSVSYDQTLNWLRLGWEAIRGVPKKPFTEEHKQKLSRAHIGVPLSENQRRAQSIAKFGVPKSEAHKQTMRVPKKIAICPYCGKVGGVGNMKRWHFNNCKAC